MAMKYMFEICANSAESCWAARQGGAHRVELCAGIPEGGTTPSYGEMVAARQIPGLRLHVIIRPRGGDFVYTPQELDIMETDIKMARQAGADGVVFGCLKPDATLDMPAMERLMKAAEGMSVTCHRAFDYVADPFGALEQLIGLGVDRILTSGQQVNALKGAPLLAELVRKADGRIIILCGCGVNEKNIAELARITGASEFHFSARENVESTMQVRNPDLAMGAADADEYVRPVTTVKRVHDTIAALLGE